MRIEAGKRLKSSYQKKNYQVEMFLADGGQGQSYKARDLDSNSVGVIKVFYSDYNNKETRDRVDFLLKSEIVEPQFSIPEDKFDTDSMIAHFTPYVGEKSVEELLENPEYNFSSALQLAIALSHSIQCLHDRGIIHGDLHSENLRVSSIDEVYELYIIDLDNIVAPSLPPPTKIGHCTYIAPELRQAMKQNKSANLSKESELYSLGVLLHEILLLQSPFNRYDKTEEEFDFATQFGWIMDPASGSHKHDPELGGFPPTILNSNLLRLFRRALSPDPSKRPSALDWKKELLEVFHQWYYKCDGCGAPIIAEIGVNQCQICNQPFPHMIIEPRGTEIKIALNKASITIGRNQLGGSQKVSAQHAVFSRKGPATFIESIGRNGTFRWNGDSWTRLPDRKRLLVMENDILRFADTETVIKMSA